MRINLLVGILSKSLFNLGLAFTIFPTLFIPRSSLFVDWSSFPFFTAKVDFFVVVYLKLPFCTRHLRKSMETGSLILTTHAVIRVETRKILTRYNSHDVTLKICIVIPGNITLRQSLCVVSWAKRFRRGRIQLPVLWSISCMLCVMKGVLFCLN